MPRNLLLLDSPLVAHVVQGGVYEVDVGVLVPAQNQGCVLGDRYPVPDRSRDWLARNDRHPRADVRMRQKVLACFEQKSVFKYY